MSIYKFEPIAIYALFVIAIPCIMLVGGVAVIVAVLAQQDRSAGMVAFVGFWWAAMLFGVYRQATMPHTIEVADDGRIRFAGTFRTMIVDSSDVVSVRAIGGSMVRIKHVGGKLFLLQQFTGFHEFLTELRRANPTVKMRGV